MTLTKTELGLRIRSARETAGFTQEQLAQAIELPRLAITQIESGSRSVSSLELDRIAYTLGRDIKSFFASEFSDNNTLSALFRLDAQLSQQPELLQGIQSSLALGREMTQLERLLGIDRVQRHVVSHTMAAPKNRWEAIQQGQQVAIDERQRLDLGMSPLGNLIELIENQGIRTASVPLPDNISGLTFFDIDLGIFILINQGHGNLRSRFSLAHEYAHVLLDRQRMSTISRTENRDELLEVRANAFAATFMMPDDGVMQYVRGLGKGNASRAQDDIFDGTEAVHAEQRAIPGSQSIQIHDVVRLADHFGMSRIATLYRLKSLKLIDDAEFRELKAAEDAGIGRTTAQFLASDHKEHIEQQHAEHRRRILSLALEAVRREIITDAKVIELAELTGISRRDAKQFLATASTH